MILLGPLPRNYRATLLLDDDPPDDPPAQHHNPIKFIRRPKESVVLSDSLPR